MVILRNVRINTSNVQRNILYKHELLTVFSATKQR